MSENESSKMRVVVRIRPMSSREIENEEERVIEQIDDKALVFDPEIEEDAYLQGFQKVARLGGKKNRKHRPRRNNTFCFDAVFGDSSTQQEVYEQTTADTIDTILEGYNATVFAYGATGAGKTHTMLGTPEDPGVIYRTVTALFAKMAEMRESSTGTKYKITVNYLEVYNERINDLLSAGKKSKDLPMRDIAGAINIRGLSEKEPQTAEELMTWLKEGNNLRTQHPTDANAQSSRSHAVFVVHFTQINGTTRTMAKLTLVDLAGSERAQATPNMGLRLREGGNINKSLLALGNVINALADPKHKGHINYRDSKLTRILKDGLGGTCRTIMIANVSPADKVYEDTLNTIKYADRAKSIRSSLTKRVMETKTHVGNYKKIIDEQKIQIKRLQEEIIALKKNGPTLKSGRVTKAVDPIWGTLTKLQSEVIRLTGDQRIAMFEKQMKIFDYEVKTIATENLERTPGSNRFERITTSYDMRVSRIEEKIEEHISQIKNTVPQEKPSDEVRSQQAAEVNYQKSVMYQNLCGKLFNKLKEQHQLVVDVAGCNEIDKMPEILCPSKSLVSFTDESLPDFLKIETRFSFDDFVPAKSLARTRRGINFNSTETKKRPVSSSRTRLPPASTSSLKKTKSDPALRSNLRTPVNRQKSATTFASAESKKLSAKSKKRSAESTSEKVASPSSSENTVKKRKTESPKNSTKETKSTPNTSLENEPDQEKPVPRYMRPTATSDRHTRIRRKIEERRKGNAMKLQELKERQQQLQANKKAFPFTKPE
ncbi:unnamed protein product [Oikopleura dioica]|uniref:Kinesin-like protein n=1 Tax=Oikopleura dioica TaxID=34765 RepID=E4YP16_OIKDI|nr:unnamed protein product [Oikopleura dioica]